jgi:hypothetical protein
MVVTRPLGGLSTVVFLGFLENVSELTGVLSVTKIIGALLVLGWLAIVARQPVLVSAVDRLERGWRNLVLVHLPVHASWLNQLEIYYSIVQRKVLEPNDFVSLADRARTLNAIS